MQFLALASCVWRACAQPGDRVDLEFSPCALRKAYEDGTAPDAVQVYADLSAAVSDGDYLWVASDETASVERLSYDRADRHFAGHKSFPLKGLEGVDLRDELDIEGLDISTDGDSKHLWIVGSHSSKRKKADRRVGKGKVGKARGRTLTATHESRASEQALVAALTKAFDKAGVAPPTGMNAETVRISGDTAVLGGDILTRKRSWSVWSPDDIERVYVVECKQEYVANDDASDWVADGKCGVLIKDSAVGAFTDADATGGKMLWDDTARDFRRLAELSVEPKRHFLARYTIDGGKLKKGVQVEASLLGRDHGSRLTDLIAKDEHLGPFVDAYSCRPPIPSKDNGLDIEAIAVHGGDVLLGLRGPVLRGWAVLLAVPVTAGKDALSLDDTNVRKYLLDLGGLGIRDLSRDGRDLLVLAGPTLDVDGPFRIYRLHGGVDFERWVPAGKSDQGIGRGVVKRVADLCPGPGVPEGLVAHYGEGGDKALVVYDNPPAHLLPAFGSTARSVQALSIDLS